MNENGPVDRRAVKENDICRLELLWRRVEGWKRPFNNISVHTNIHILSINIVLKIQLS